MTLETQGSRFNKTPSGLFKLLDTELDEGVSVRLSSVWNDRAYSLRSVTILEDASGSLQQPALGYAVAPHISTALAGAIFDHDKVRIDNGSTDAPVAFGWNDIDAMFNVENEIWIEKKMDKIISSLSNEAVRSLIGEADSSEASLRSLANYFRNIEIV